MPIPPPTKQQARILWFSLTALAVGLVLALIGMLTWGLGFVLGKLTAVLLPLALAAIITYLLDPVVDLLERKISRTWSIVVVFGAGLLVVGGLLATVLPRLIGETEDLIHRIPAYTEKAQTSVTKWLSESPWPRRLQRIISPVKSEKRATNAEVKTNIVTNAGTNSVKTASSPETLALSAETSRKATAWFARVLPDMGRWLLAQLQNAVSWVGLLLGLLLTPVYVFYLLREKKDIVRSWTDYLPMRESRTKEEVIFILTSINDSVIVFFRGQVLVALCTGTLLTISFFSLGLNYALLLGVMAGFLGIIPYLGVLISLTPAVALAAMQYGDWLHPILVCVVFAVVNMLEGLVISPKIIGDRVGLHPLTVIIAVMVGTALMGGIMGGVLAIPLTAALRAMMFRYVWKKQGT